MNKLSLFILLLSFNSQAAFQGFCFTKSTSLSIVRAMVSSIKLKKDNIKYKDGSNCLEIETTSNRIELYDRMLSQHFGIIDRYGSGGTQNTYTVSKNSAHCKFNLEEKILADTEETNIKAGKRNKLGRKRNKRDKTINTSLMVISNRFASIQMADQTAYMKCIPRGQNYEVEFALSSDDSSVRSSVILVPGQKMEVGSVIQDLNKKSKELGIPKGIDYSKTTGFENKKYFLSIK